MSSTMYPYKYSDEVVSARGRHDIVHEQPSRCFRTKYMYVGDVLAHKD
jgi:hypothetical protein